VRDILQDPNPEAVWNVDESPFRFEAKNKVIVNKNKDNWTVTPELDSTTVVMCVNAANSIPDNIDLHEV